MRDQVRTSYRISSVAMVSKAIGGVSPIGWLNPATIIIDEALSDYEIVWAAAGHPHTVFPTTYTELLKSADAQSMKVAD